MRNFLKQKLCEDPCPQPLLDGASFNQFFLEDNQMFVENFEEQEIKDAIWDCYSKKSPRMDDLHFHFLKT